MALSGSIDFTLTAAQVIDEAFKIIQVAIGETPLQAFEQQDGLRALNLLMTLSLRH